MALCVYMNFEAYKHHQHSASSEIMKTYQAHDTAQPTRVASAHHATHFGLHEHLHHHHRRTINGILLATRCRAAALVEKLRRFRHGQADEVRGRTAAGTASEALQDLMNVSRS